jgi:hypothetical protein
MNDLELSEKVMSDVLVGLFNQGLRGSDIQQVSDITNENIDDAFLMSVMQWLQREGLVHFKFIDATSMQGRAGFYLGSCLTSRGFAAMGTSFIGDQTIGNVSEGNAKFTNVGDFIGGLLGGFTKSISS